MFRRNFRWWLLLCQLLLPDGRGFNQRAGLRTYGGISRCYPQKGLKI